MKWLCLGRSHHFFQKSCYSTRSYCSHHIYILDRKPLRRWNIHNTSFSIWIFCIGMNALSEGLLLSWTTLTPWLLPCCQQCSGNRYTRNLGRNSLHQHSSHNKISGRNFFCICILFFSLLHFGIQLWTLAFQQKELLDPSKKGRQSCFHFRLDYLHFPCPKRMVGRVAQLVHWRVAPYDRFPTETPCPRWRGVPSST